MQSLHEGHGRQGSIQLKNDGNNSQDHRLTSSAQINRMAVFVIAVDIPSHDARHGGKDRLLPITFVNRVGEAADQRRRPKNRQTKKDMHASPEGVIAEERSTCRAKCAYSCRTTLKRDESTWRPPLYLIKPSFLNLFMKKFTRERVVPTISARVSWDILAIIF